MTWKEIKDWWDDDRKMAKRVMCDTCRQGEEIGTNTRVLQRILLKLGEGEDCKVGITEKPPQSGG